MERRSRTALTNLRDKIKASRRVEIVGRPGVTGVVVGWVGVRVLVGVIVDIAAGAKVVIGGVVVVEVAVLPKLAA